MNESVSKILKRSLIAGTAVGALLLPTACTSPVADDAPRRLPTGPHVVRTTTAPAPQPTPETRSEKIGKLKLDLVGMAMTDIEKHRPEWSIKELAPGTVEFMRNDPYDSGITAEFGMIQPIIDAKAPLPEMPDPELVSSITFDVLPADNREPMYAINVRFDEESFRFTGNAVCGSMRKGGMVVLDYDPGTNTEISDELFGKTRTEALEVAASIFDGRVTHATKPVAC